MELTYLRNIVSDLEARFRSKVSPSAFQLKRELLVLGKNEKLLIRKNILGKLTIMIAESIWC